MRRLLKLLAGLVLVLVVVMVANTLTFTSKQVDVAAAEPVAIDVDAAARRLGGALQFETISHEDPALLDAATFLRFHRYLEENFPLVHAKLAHETVNDLSLLYRWQGRAPELAPIILLSHFDVVPVVPGTEDRWEQPPYSGAIADGFIWGRGALDDKFGVLGILESVEHLLGQGFAPARTVYLAFGHDEEVGGDNGAAVIAKLLQERGVEPEMVLDEGGAMVVEVVPYLDAPVAMIGVAEKGSVTLELTVEAQGGHSSTPPKSTAIGVLSRAIVRLERNQMPAELRGAARQFFDYVGPELFLPLRVAFANLWLLRRPIEDLLEDAPATNAMLRTTTAATIISGGVKSNVLPTDARAIVNFRILPGDTIVDVIEHARSMIDDPTVTIEPSGVAREASRESPVDSAAFAFLQQTIAASYPNVIVAPFLTVGGTDSRHFTDLTPNVYRFTPILARQEDLARIHGTNERVGVADYGKAVGFFVTLLRGLPE